MITVGDCIEVIKTLAPDSVDAIVTDPPAGIAFMGKEWDKDKGGRDAWIAWASEVAREALRVLKPGAHAFVWALPRTSHWTATAWEDGGFEVRDRIVHAFGSGFPKSLDVSKAIDKMMGAEREVVGKHHAPASEIYQSGKLIKDVNITAPATPEAQAWAGFGTALKPAVEDWWLLRKPIEKGLTIAENCLKWGVGALDIDGARIEAGENENFKRPVNHTGLNEGWDRPWRHNPEHLRKERIKRDASQAKAETLGRWPANLTHDGSDEVTGRFPETGISSGGGMKDLSESGLFQGNTSKNLTDSCGLGDSGSASRFFYCAKPSPSERGPGNNHPTVKSIALMAYLIKLIAREGQTVLDPFAGSGTTGVACQRLGREFIGIELDPEYAAIARKRIAGDMPLFDFGEG